MSEAEQYWMRLRLEGGRMNKARRGEYFFAPPAGYVWDRATSRFRLDPDEQVQEAVHLIFERFRLDGSAYAVARHFFKHGLKMPYRHIPTRELRWSPARDSLVRRKKKTLPQAQWKVCLKDHHPAYISWEQYMTNQKALFDNRTTLVAQGARGACREGTALLQGLALCGRCGQRMMTHYVGTHQSVKYQCRPRHMGDTMVCFEVPGKAVDAGVARLFLEVVQPPEIELGLEVMQQFERQTEQMDRQWTLRLERAQYEAQLSERRYKAVDPDNRVVARTLEREWNEKLKAIQELEEERLENRRRQKVELTAQERAQILGLARDLRRVWEADTTTFAERKNLLRMLIQEVTLTPVEQPQRSTKVQVLWQTGATSEFTVPRPTKQTVSATPVEAITIIEKMLAQGHSDQEMADELNRLGIWTGKGLTWSIPAVRIARYTKSLHRLSPKAHRARKQRADGLYSIHGVAAVYGVSPGIVHYWARKGWLPIAEPGRHGCSHWIRLDEATVGQVERATGRRPGGQTGNSLTGGSLPGGSAPVLRFSPRTPSEKRPAPASHPTTCA
jgi:hypothetical protein